MLNKAVIERFSSTIIPYCESAGVEYKASLICNGTAWPSDAVAFVESNRLHSIQFSLDGPERYHNTRRGLVNSDCGSGRSASFNQVMGVIGALVGSTQIYLRVNVDPWIGRDALEVVELFASRGWLVVRIKRLAPPQAPLTNGFH